MTVEDLQASGTPFSLSFSGSGFLALYQVGVVQSLLELAPELLKSACKVYGSSAGSLIAAAVVCGISLGKEITTFFATEFLFQNGTGGDNILSTVGRWDVLLVQLISLIMHKRNLQVMSLLAVTLKQFWVVSAEKASYCCLNVASDGWVDTAWANLDIPVYCISSSTCSC